MTKKIFITAFVLLVLWNIILIFLPKGINTEQHQWNGNLILAQEYLYNTDVSGKDIMLGSSFAYRLRDSLPKNMLSLSFGGQSVFDGLLVVDGRKEKPENIYMEMNVVLRAENDPFQEYIFSPTQYTLRRYLPGLQVKNQPVGILKGLIMGKKNENQKANQKEETFNEAFMDIRREKHAQAASEKELDVAFTKLKKIINQLRKDDTRIIFFEMPVHKELCNSPFSTSVRSRFKKEFPEGEYIYINQPDCSGYRTTDGGHLNKKDVSRYMRYFNDEVRRINRKGQPNQ